MFQNFSNSGNNFLLNQNLFSSSFGNFCEKHNFVIVNAFSKFLNSDDKYFLFEGAKGSGKSQLLKSLTSIAGKKAAVLSFDCSSICSVDDFLLDMIKQLRRILDKTGSSRINTSTNDFREKIRIYIKNIRQPIIIFVDSFDVIKYLQNKIEIFQMIQHLTDTENIKACFALRKVDEQLFDTDKLQRASIPEFSKGEVREYLKSNNKNLTQEIFEKFYTLTGGKCLYFTLFTKMSSIFNISIESLMNEYFKKGHDIEEFLITKFIGLIPHNYMDLLWTICIAQSFVNEKMLANLKLIQRDELRYLEKINILYSNQSNYYLKDYVKRFIEPQIDYYNKAKINKMLSEYYNSQLALKPLKRDLTISRETLRALIKYHGGTSKDKPKDLLENSKSSEIQIMQQAPVQEYTQESDVTVEQIQDELTEQVSTSNPSLSSSSVQSKGLADSSIININYTINQPPQPPKKEVPPQEKKQKTPPKVKEKPNSADYTAAAEKYEEIFKYEEANECYLKALEFVLDDERYSIILKMADNYHKLHDWDNAIKYYKDAANYEKSKKNFEKYAEILYIIALIYKGNYKAETAKKYFLEICSMGNKASAELVAKTNLQLTEFVSDFTQDELQGFYKSAFAYVKKTENQNLASEIYFRYALWLDDEGFYDEAITNYLSCTIACSDFKENKFLSSAFANVASVYQEKDDYKNALKYYSKALEIDNENSNYEGKYYIYTNLAQIYQKTDPTRVTDAYKKALFAAQKLDDNFYICSVLVNIGDFYYQENKSEFALKYYLLSKKYALGLKSFDNTNIIKSRIADIKVKMGKEKFKEYMQSMKRGSKKSK